MQLRVMAWNVHGFAAGTRAIAEAVRRENPDVLLLNETGYLGFRLRRFARRAGMEGATGATLRWRIPNAVLVREPWRPVVGEVAVLPRSRRTRRGVVMGLIGHGGVRLWAIAVHLGLSAEERREHALIMGRLFRDREPLVLGGDLNEDPLGGAATFLGDHYRDAGLAHAVPTFPARDPRSRIDYVFVSPGIALDAFRTGDERFGELSDHLPVIADLSIVAARRAARR
jgi:endonuclease/exonuclease/phosphatase family metal-dependent hydrolase